MKNNTVQILNSIKLLTINNSHIHGKGLFATDAINKGNKISYFKGYETKYGTIYSLTFENKNIEPTGVLKYLNHSCSPNARFFDRWLVASRYIEFGEEITIDYKATESNISHHFECNCNSPNCVLLL